MAPSIGVPKIVSDGQIAGLALDADLSKPDAEIAVAVALAESGGNTNAHNPVPPDDSYGLWQINMYGDLGPKRREQFKIKDNAQLTDPRINANAMRLIKQGFGWQAWSTYKSGRFQSYMDRARRAVANPEKVDISDVVDAATANPMDIIFSTIGKVLLRVAMFLGGGVLIILAVWLYVKEQT